MFLRFRRYILALVSFFCLLIPAKSQDTSHLRISLLTCAPGDELYSIFGHSALRVTDSVSMTDIVFNYGTFNFDEEDFYIKFMRGKLLYYLSIEDFYNFRMAYARDGRNIREQVLLLSADEKIRMREKLIDNLSEDKKYYLYDFFLDNCTTRLRDLITEGKSPRPVLPAVMRTSTTFRNAIHFYLDKGNQPWSKLGIDILLGARTDRIMTTAEQEFLPENLMSSVDSCQNTSLIQSTEQYPATDTYAASGFFNPILFFSLLLLIMLLICRSSSTQLVYAAAGLDNFIFFMTGILGVILILMWIGTDHKMTKDNYNLLWAWPFHTAAVLLPRHATWVKRYFLLHGIFLCLLLACWFFLPQKMNPSLLPFIALLIYLSFRRSAR
jgi:hypothetical protein